MITELTNCYNHPNVKTKWVCDRCFTSICELDHKTKGQPTNFEMYCFGCYDTMKYRNAVLLFFIISFLIFMIFGWATTSFMDWI